MSHRLRPFTWLDILTMSPFWGIGTRLPGHAGRSPHPFKACFLNSWSLDFSIFYNLGRLRISKSSRSCVCMRVCVVACTRLLGSSFFSLPLSLAFFDKQKEETRTYLNICLEISSAKCPSSLFTSLLSTKYTNQFRGASYHLHKYPFPSVFSSMSSFHLWN